MKYTKVYQMGVVYDSGVDHCTMNRNIYMLLHDSFFWQKMKIPHKNNRNSLMILLPCVGLMPTLTFILVLKF